MSGLEDEAREEVLYAGADADAAFARARALLWSYRIYPPSLVTGALDAPRAGAVIHQTIRAGPLRFRAPVRIVEAWDAPTRAGYRYEALPGHAERGWASFELTRDASRVALRIASRAAFAHWLARLGAPFARRLRQRAIDGAFERMRRAARGDAP